VTRDDRECLGGERGGNDESTVTSCETEKAEASAAPSLNGPTTAQTQEHEIGPRRGAMRAHGKPHADPSPGERAIASQGSKIHRRLGSAPKGHGDAANMVPVGCDAELKGRRPIERCEDGLVEMNLEAPSRGSRADLLDRARRKVPRACCAFRAAIRDTHARPRREKRW